MNIEMARGFFLWYSVINYAVLLLWVALVLFLRGPLNRLLCAWFRLTPEQWDVINVAGISFYKVGILLFNLVPCVALYLI